jgi:hypothetical protein
MSFTLTEISNPAGIVCVTLSPDVDSTTILVFPFSPGVIAVT